MTCADQPPTLAPGESVTCTAMYTITQEDLDAGVVINHATASASYDNTPVFSNTDTAIVIVDKNPALEIVKSVTPGTYDHVGEELTYSYVVTNTGNVTMTEPVTVTDDRATPSPAHRTSSSPRATPCPASRPTRSPRRTSTTAR